MAQASRYNEAYYIPLLPPFLCCDTNFIRYRHLHGVQDANAQERLHDANLYADLVNSKKRETAEKISLK